MSQNQQNQQAQLDQALEIVRRITLHSGAAQGLAVNAHRLEGEALRARLAEVTEQAKAADEAALDLFWLLTAMGAVLLAVPSRTGTIPLHLLSTDAGRTLLLALAVAKDVAQEVDQELGWIDEDGQGIGYTEAIGDIAVRLRGEFDGPKGRD